MTPRDAGQNNRTKLPKHVFTKRNHLKLAHIEGKGEGAGTPNALSAAGLYSATIRLPFVKSYPSFRRSSDRLLYRTQYSRLRNPKPSHTDDSGFLGRADAVRSHNRSALPRNDGGSRTSTRRDFSVARTRYGFANNARSLEMTVASRNPPLAPHSPYLVLPLLRQNLMLVCQDLFLVFFYLSLICKYLIQFVLVRFDFGLVCFYLCLIALDLTTWLLLISDLVRLNRLLVVKNSLLVYQHFIVTHKVCSSPPQSIVRQDSRTLNCVINRWRKTRAIAFINNN